jgi:hypothetical protein
VNRDKTYDYAIVRVVPRVERGEFVNAGIILSCDVERILLARIELDETRVLALDPRADLGPIRDALTTIPVLCAGGPGAGRIGAGGSEEHHRTNLARAYRTMCRPRGGARAPHEYHGPALNQGRASRVMARSSRSARSNGPV